MIWLWAILNASALHCIDVIKNATSCRRSTALPSVLLTAKDACCVLTYLAVCLSVKHPPLQEASLRYDAYVVISCRNIASVCLKPLLRYRSYSQALCRLFRRPLQYVSSEIPPIGPTSTEALPLQRGFESTAHVLSLSLKHGRS